MLTLCVQAEPEPEPETEEAPEETEETSEANEAEDASGERFVRFVSHCRCQLLSAIVSHRQPLSIIVDHCQHSNRCPI